MSDTEWSYKLSELPDNLMISPKFLFDWWDQVAVRYGAQRALEDKSADFKLARELWVAAVFACCKRLSSTSASRLHSSRNGSERSTTANTPYDNPMMTTA